MAELGWLGAAIDERYGGSGGDIVDLALLVQGLAPGDPAIGPFFTTVCFGGKSVGFFGSEAQKAFYLPRIAAGGRVFALSITEPGGGTDVLGAMQTRARREGDGWVLTGARMFTSGAPQADHLLVVARTARPAAVRKAAEGITLFIVAARAPGVSMRKLDMLPDLPVVVGGILPEEDPGRLRELGVAGLFQPGATLASIAAFFLDLGLSARSGDTGGPG